MHHDAAGMIGYRPIICFVSTFGVMIQEKNVGEINSEKCVPFHCCQVLLTPGSYELGEFRELVMIKSAMSDRGIV